MSAIYKNGEWYGKESNGNELCLTQAEFNALPKTEQDNGTTYYISDGDGVIQNTVMGYTPIGTIISVMGNSAPIHYLKCEGQTVNITDYPELAVYFEQQFGSKNYFGGDGTTTFGIPDLRGEFLRGTGENGHADQGSGGDVGEHQDSTEIPTIGTNNNGLVFGNVYNKQYFVGANKDAQRIGRTGYGNGGSYTASAASADYRYMIRPTNTSVLYCIATKNIYTNPENIYSTDEIVVGKWIDGRPLYQKTYTCTTPSSAGTVLDVATLADEIESRKIDGMVNCMVPVNYYGSTTYYSRCYTIDKKLHIAVGGYVNMTAYITLKYTKTTD